MSPSTREFKYRNIAPGRIRRAKTTKIPIITGVIEKDSSGFTDGVGEGSDEEEGEGAGAVAGAGAGTGPQLPGILL